MKLTKTCAGLPASSHPFYICHCITHDYALDTKVARRIDELYNMREKLKHFYGDSLEYGEAYLVDNVFNLVAKIDFMDIEGAYDVLEEALYDMRYQMRESMITKLIIPKLGYEAPVELIIADVFEDMDVEIVLCVEV